MNYYLFPYRSIKAGNRIVLYAAGDVGQDYYRQLSDTGYGEVVLWLDQKLIAWNVQHPDTIRNFPNDAYDAIVIAISQSEIAVKIRSYLIDVGVLPEKIFYMPPVLSSTMGRSSRLTIEDLMGNQELVLKALLEYFDQSSGEISYFESLINVLRNKGAKSEQFKNDVIQRAIEIVNAELESPELRLVLLRLLYEAECFNHDLMRLYVASINDLRNNCSQKYWLMQDLSIMWVFYPHILYDRFWLERREIMRSYADELQLLWNPPQYQRENNNAICLIVNGLFNDSITRFCSPIARELMRRGYKVHVININPYKYDVGANFLKPRYYHASPGIVEEELDLIKGFYPNPIELHYSESATMRERQQDVLNLIESINPYCILDVTDECGAISYYYYRNYPTIYLPLRKEGESSSFFHKIVVSDGHSVQAMPPIEEKQIMSIPSYMEYAPPKKVFDRQKHGFSSNDVIVVTVGKRLDFDISPELANQFCNAMSANPRIKWICVCPIENAFFETHYSELLDKQIFQWGFEDDLPSLYRMCDIYLNPLRFGGGTTIAWAMQQGRALASPLGADAGVWHAGTEFAVENEADLVPYVIAMANDPMLLSRNQKAMRSKASKWSIDVYADRLIAGMNDVADQFTRKFKGSDHYE